MSFLIKDDQILEKYNEILEIVRNSVKKTLLVNSYTMTIYKILFLKAKIKF